MATKVIYKQAWLNAIAASDYEQLDNRPQINGVELLDNLNTEDAKITWFGTQADFNALTPNDKTLYIIEDGIPTGDLIDYIDLINKPTLNGIDVVNAKSSDDFGMYNKDEVDNILASLRSIYSVPSIPSPPNANTMYYVGPNSEGIYHVYLYDSLSNQIDLGLSKNEAYKAGTAISINNSTNMISARSANTTIEYDDSEGFYIKDMESSTSSAASKVGIAPAPPANSTTGVRVLADNAEWKKLVNLIYPVGSIYLTVDPSGDPNTMFGGNWGIMASGRVLIGVTSSDSDFNESLKYAGNKTVTLTTDQLPSHNHSLSPALLHDSATWSTKWGTDWSQQSTVISGNPPATGSVGGGQAHNNLMPYITAYIWRRTA